MYSIQQSISVNIVNTITVDTYMIVYTEATPQLLVHAHIRYKYALTTVAII